MKTGSRTFRELCIGTLAKNKRALTPGKIYHLRQRKRAVNYIFTMRFYPCLLPWVGSICTYWGYIYLNLRIIFKRICFVYSMSLLRVSRDSCWNYIRSHLNRYTIYLQLPLSKSTSKVIPGHRIFWTSTTQSKREL